MPGVGPGLSNIVSYLAAKNNSTYPEKFGTGIPDGVVASEAANNASIGGAMVPLVTLGIPGDATTALLLGALTLHGLRPGPMLMVTNEQIVYGIFGALIIANFFMLVIEFFGMRVFTRLLVIQKHYLLPVVIALCVIGCIGINNRVFDAITIFIFAVVGFLLKKIDVPLTPVVLGFILCPMAEENLRRALQLSRGSFLPFVTRPISLIFLSISVLMVVLAARKSWKQRKRTPIEGKEG
jgi:putative tricarboxylic transport membrane protein